MTRALRITVACLDDCGLLGAGLSTDPPGARPPNWKGPYRDGTWTRVDELDRVAAAHARTHPTRISATPEAT
jgi:hypothetical protein